MTKAMTAFLMVMYILANESHIPDYVDEICPEAKVYENHNQYDYGPLKMHKIAGRGILDIENGNHGTPIRSCLSIFSEKKHKWVRTEISDSNGKFQFNSVKSGRYRLVARALGKHEGLCEANIPITVIGPGEQTEFMNEPILIHFRLRTRDGCSFGEISD
jgi:hypothetical protein